MASVNRVPEEYVLGLRSATGKRKGPIGPLVGIGESKSIAAKLRRGNAEPGGIRQQSHKTVLRNVNPQLARTAPTHPKNGSW
jgi:hypothetical protein